jgi:5-hydroxyisourate hydrolase
MGSISTHVLDVALGRPAARVPVTLETAGTSTCETLTTTMTDDNGRVAALLPAGHQLRAGLYRLTFDTGAYFRARNVDGFFPEVAILFEVRDDSQHYHVPLLLSPFGYSTYRGS